MKYTLQFSSLFIAGILILTAAGCSNTLSQSTTTSDKSKLQIVTSIPPLYSITANVAGDKAELYNLLPGDASEHQFSLKPSDIVYITKADAIIETGLSAEEFLQDTITQNIQPTTKVISVDHGITLLQSEDQDELGTDGHIWLSVKNAKIITQTIANQLAELDPTNAPYYQANAEAYIAQLAELDTYATDQFNSVTHKNFIPLHAAWVYLANDYNLDQVSSIELIPGQEPSAQEIAMLLGKIEEFSVPALFAEPQLENRITASLAEDTGLPIYTLDPLGIADLSKELYIDTMKSNITTLSNALR